MSTTCYIVLPLQCTDCSQHFTPLHNQTQQLINRCHIISPQPLNAQVFRQTLLQLVGGTELEDSPKQRFHISRSFLSDACQNKKCRAETAYKSAKREIVSDWTKSVDQSKTEALERDFQRIDKLLLPAQDWLRNFDVSGF